MKQIAKTLGVARSMAECTLKKTENTGDLNIKRLGAAQKTSKVDDPC